MTTISSTLVVVQRFEPRPLDASTTCRGIGKVDSCLYEMFGLTLLVLAKMLEAAAHLSSAGGLGVATGSAVGETSPKPQTIS